ncbi:MAG: ASCH domain-containing protein [Candidatus Caldatribacteriota bacterium]
MALLLILDREHKALWVKAKNKPRDNRWCLPEVEDPINKPSNRLNVELLAKQAFIPLKSSLIGRKSILDLYHNEQQLYLFLCAGKESLEVQFDLTKYRDIQWIPINCISELEYWSHFSVKSIMEAYYDILLTGFTVPKCHFHIVKNGYERKEIEDYNQSLLQGGMNILIELKDQYTLYHQSVPETGDYAFLNNWQGIPVAVLEITGVTIESFEKIGNLFKELDNQRELTAEDWIEQYRKTFLKWCKKYNKKFSINKSVVVSQFKIIHHFDDKKIDHLKRQK